MFRNYLKIAIRVIMRHKGFSLINILGLAVGMACVFLIALWLRFEISFDRFHEHADDIYRIYSIFQSEQGADRFIGTPAPLAAALKNEFPEILHTVRFGGAGPIVIEYKTSQFREQSIIRADNSLFEIFSFPLKAGDPSNALLSPYSVVISEGRAAKYFGTEDPMGKHIQIHEGWKSADYVVTGILRNMPANSQLQFDMVIPFQQETRWGMFNYRTYIRTAKNADSHALEKKISGFLKKITDGEQNAELGLQSLTSIHLFSDFRGELSTQTDFNHILLFSGAALLILLIACMNFVNLTTALSSVRAKEVGIRKALGATRRVLISQFLGESFLLSLIAFTLAIVFAEILLPVFNMLAGTNLSYSLAGEPDILLIFICLTGVIGLLSGGYPAFFMSSFRPHSMALFRRAKDGYASSATIRTGLLILQFVITILFLVSTLIIYRQLHFMRAKNLGYDKDFLVVLPVNNYLSTSQLSIFKAEILKYSDILSATKTSFRPGTHTYYQNAWYEGLPRDESVMMHWFPVDHDFVKTLGLSITQGRDFSQDVPADTAYAYLVNEAFVQNLRKSRPELENPVGKEFMIARKVPGRIIGVVKDFHFESLHDRLEPLAMCIYPFYDSFVARVNQWNVAGALEILEKEWKRMFPREPFEYSFFDQDFERVYRAEIKLGRLFNYVAGLTLFTTCIGLLGLVSFAAERRTKEIGIRKVLGASVTDIMLRLATDFSKWVIVANIIAAPIAWYAMEKWLQNFPYRIYMGPGIFIVAGLLTVILSSITIAYQVIRAARANPVEALRYE